MMKFTVDYNDEMLRWDVVRWDVSAEGARVGTTVDRCSTEAEAKEICDYHNDMLNPEFWSERGCVFGREMS
jgi:hypothetical protein